MDFKFNINKLSKYAKYDLYMDTLNNIFNSQALFSDGTTFYRYPSEPDPNDIVRLRFRTARENIDTCYAIVNDVRYEMERIFNDRNFDYYDVEVQLGSEMVYYYFEVHSGPLVCYYNAIGALREINHTYDFKITPGFHTPDWAKGAVFYQIYVDRFFNGNPDNDVLNDEYFYIGDSSVKVEDWNKYPAAMGVREFYGGDLQGVMEKLDYLQELGIDAIYFNPLFVSPSNHKYDIQDYDYIDPHIGVLKKDEGELINRDGNGTLLYNPECPNKDATRYITRVTDKENLDATNEYFAKLVEEAHKRGIKVILDGVFNHCGSFNKWLDRERIYENADGYAKGAFVDKDSPYHRFFKFRGGNWPYNYNYDGWWGHDTLPKLNYEESPELVNYIMEIGRKWVSPPYNVDGWRLDVAADLGQSEDYNHYFWKEFRRNVKEANPEAIILAEHYGDPKEWLLGDQWDTVMNYDAFMEPLTWFLTGMEKHSDEYRENMLGNADAFFGAMGHFMSRFNIQSLFVAMNELSNHDHSRFLTRTNRTVGRTASLGPDAANHNVNKGVMMLAVMVQMTWPGAPTLYYGDEAGVCGWTDPDSRRTYPWGHEDKNLIAYHRDMIKIHKQYTALKTGSIIFLQSDYNVICFGRFDERGKMIIIINNNDYEKDIQIPVWRIGIEKDERIISVIKTRYENYSLETQIYNHDGGLLNFKCEPCSGVVLRNYV
ncbi:MAG: glycoside hydrolase family 13 protein [Lachnospiraceae bacterium]|nr:glycoside hydrolase family 13 protein [Lachnospiraceae bacterium]